MADVATKCVDNIRDEGPPHVVRKRHNP